MSPDERLALARRLALAGVRLFIDSEREVVLRQSGRSEAVEIATHHTDAAVAAVAAVCSEIRGRQ